MRARNVLCTLGVGALAMSVSAYAAPREAQTGKSPRPESSRLIAGQSGEIRNGIDNGTVAAGSGTRVKLTPVAIFPPANGSISGQTATLTGAATNVKFDCTFGGWGAASNLNTFQATIDTGTLAPLAGPGSLLGPPTDVCLEASAAYSPTCGAAFGSSGNPGGLQCNNYNPIGSTPDTGQNKCDWLWQEVTRATWPTAFNFNGCNSSTYSCGSSTSNAPLADNGAEWYNFTMVLRADASAAGTYDVSFDPVLDPGGNVMQVVDGTEFHYAKVTAGSITIPTGSCCFNLGLPNSGCDDAVDQDACSSSHVGQVVWTKDKLCSQGCAECINDGQCNDNDSCTTEFCSAALTCTRGVVAIGADQCCNGAVAAPGNITTISDDGDPCTVDKCVGTCPLTTQPPGAYPASACGTADHVPADPGDPCDDNNPCTGFDVCDAIGGCAGTNVNGEVCVVDADCQDGGTPGAVCDGGACLCALNPNVSIVLSHDTPDPDKDAACYLDNEKVTATVHIGPAANNIVGVQFAIVYDLSCLTFNSVQPAGPWTLNLMTRLGGTCAGGVNDGQSCATGCGGGGGTCVPADTIFTAWGIPLGGVGAEGNADALVLSFTKKVGCVSCDICFSNNNPLHTYFSDDTGQQVGADTKCSDEIRTKSPIDLDTPDTIKVNKGCDSNVATVTWPAPSAGFGCNEGNLECNGIHLESGTPWDDAHVQGGGVFPGGNSNFCCTATNDCGNLVEKCWTVTVNDETSLEVEVQLSPTMNAKPGKTCVGGTDAGHGCGTNADCAGGGACVDGGLIRCIKFEVFNNCVQAPVVFETDLAFGGLLQLVGHFNGHIKIPAAVQPACITARDQHHTLRSCYTFGEGDCDSNGVLHASFKQDPFFGGNWLIGGNLDGWKKSNPNASHDIIDILDFGTLVAEWLESYDSDGVGGPDGNTPCAQYGDATAGLNHADINGDGLVDLLDFSFIQMNFLDNSKDCCCPGSASLGNTVGRTEITVRELREQGMDDLSVADLNADGKVDMADMAALMTGGRPNLKANDGGKDGSRSNNRK